MTDKTKNKLAKINGLSKERYEDQVKANIRFRMPVDDELAILRKAIVNLYDIVSQIHPEMKNNEEFQHYNEMIERIKILYKE